MVVAKSHKDKENRRKETKRENGKKMDSLLYDLQGHFRVGMVLNLTAFGRVKGFPLQKPGMCQDFEVLVSSEGSE